MIDNQHSKASTRDKIWCVTVFSLLFIGFIVAPTFNARWLGFTVPLGFFVWWLYPYAENKGWISRSPS